ncbi:thiol peroxidase (atypical 2-Cys peroxiredoxin) [Neorhodopirellula lusitana]|uniref:Thiol peroxidase (Atypical 2-Cys peroxiredoxin) n=1 Tax=Neorhodopirellula lusitana TaxID=445327 RepID=A0ABY1PYW2_9BACT|nr:thiol peroxidase [Neorhodopirellula lusitana]SMP53243.1 thiol peroxidase (atypical 2-Cys peroxiredoxin) [Neorhodopirellula lusitana]
MSQSGVITFKGNPMTLAGSGLQVGQAAPDFQLHYAHEGLKALTLADLKGKPSIISVVPSLDTPTCAVQTKTFNQKLGEMGDKINAVTVSRDLPFAQARFCGAEDVKMQTASDYQTHEFGEDYGVEIEELKLLSRSVFVLDAEGKVTYKEIVSEVTEEPNYDAALQALTDLA